MEILILVGQRKCRYPGEYAPEVLDAIDENGNSDNPEYLISKMERYESTSEFESLAIVRVRVSGAAITEALFPAAKAIDGEVVGNA